MARSRRTSVPLSLAAMALSLVAMALSASAAQAGQTRAQAAPAGLQIRHQAVDCFMAERYPQLDACIEPSATLERARVYFRVEGGRRWHFVDMRPVGSCYQATLPRPQAQTPRIVYYVSALGIDAREARTPPRPVAVVVEDAACRGRLGPFLSAAPVAVGGGALPQGFVGVEGSVSNTAKKVVIAIVGAGAVGAGVALGTRGGGSPSTAPATTTLPGGAPTSTTILSTTTTTTTTTLPSPTPTPTPAPTPTPTPTPPPPTTTTTSTSTTTTTVPTTTTTTSSTTTTSTTSTTSSTTTSTTSTTTTSTTSTTSTTTTTVPTTTTTTTVPTTTTTTLPTTTTTTAPTTTTTTVKPFRREAQALARARSDGDGDREPLGPRPAAAARGFSSELRVADGRGQVIVNGSEVGYPGPGRSDLALPLRRGTNQVEVLLVAGSGRPGTWTFGFAAGVRPGSLRVIAAEGASVAPLSLVLRLRGRPGERAVFSVEGE